jgi:GTPase involved in cell partitioning and DNA repair
MRNFRSALQNPQPLPGPDGNPGRISARYICLVKAHAGPPGGAAGKGGAVTFTVLEKWKICANISIYTIL